MPAGAPLLPSPSMASSRRAGLLKVESAPAPHAACPSTASHKVVWPPTRGFLRSHHPRTCLLRARQGDGGASHARACLREAPQAGVAEQPGSACSCCQRRR
eukprot:357985-Chlamydomonas_euryale.AAC.5